MVAFQDFGDIAHVRLLRRCETAEPEQDANRADGIAEDDREAADEFAKADQIGEERGSGASPGTSAAAPPMSFIVPQTMKGMPRNRGSGLPTEQKQGLPRGECARQALRGRARPGGGDRARREHVGGEKRRWHRVRAVIRIERPRRSQRVQSVNAESMRGAEADPIALVRRVALEMEDAVPSHSREPSWRSA